MRVGGQIAAVMMVVVACSADVPARTDAPTPGAPDASTSAAVPAEGSGLVRDTLRVVRFGKSYPVDEAPKDPVFAAFRDRVRLIVQRRDTSALLSLLAKDIVNSFGGDGGTAEFRERWRLSDSKTTLWTVLEEILTRGGRFNSPGSFTAPYTFFGIPDSLSTFEHLIVVDSGVPVYQRPDRASDVVDLLAFDVVRADTAAVGRGWTGVVRSGARVGYVETRFVRSAVGYRVGFERRGGKWVIVFLVAGD